MKENIQMMSTRLVNIIFGLFNASIKANVKKGE